MKAKRIFLPFLLFLVLFASGCSVRIANMTPGTVPTNPSGIYTLSVQAEVQNQAIDPSSISAYVVVDGEEHEMQRSDLGGGYFDFDYAIPEGQRSARFYYVVRYRLRTIGDTPGELKEVTSPLQEIRLTDRYSITLDADRAPVGTQLAILGRGFGRNDEVIVGGVPARTRFISANVLQFIVPDLAPGDSYPVQVRGGPRVENAGLLRVDPGLPTPLTVVPGRVDLETGERQTLVFALESPAPPNGLYLNVTTDIPNSIIMPEVMIPSGSRSVNATVEGADPGEGSLFIKAEGMRELEIPVNIR